MSYTSAILLSMLPYVLSESLVYEFSVSGMYMWSSVISVVLLIVCLSFGKTVFDWKRDLVLQPLCAMVAYFDLIQDMGTFNTWSSPIGIKVSSSWEMLVFLPVAATFSLFLRRQKFVLLFKKDIAPIGMFVIGHLVCMLVALIQALMADQRITPIFLTNTISILVKEQLRSREVSIPIIVTSTCIYRFLFSADWRLVNDSINIIPFLIGLLVVIMLYSLFYICRESTVYTPMVLEAGSRIILERSETSSYNQSGKSWIPNTMMGISVLTVSIFHWYYDNELEKAEEPINGEVVHVSETIQENVENIRGYQTI
jgi:hypothetical protein